MPNRILREGIVASARVASLSWTAEVFYRRLMSVVDDFGRYYAHPMQLRAACYPLQLDKVNDAQIETWLGELQAANLIQIYQGGQSGALRYVEMLDFRQQVRAKKSKFPEPDQMIAVAAQPLRTRAARQKAIGNGATGFDEFWAAYPRKVAKATAYKAWLKLSPDDALRSRILEAVRAQAGGEQWRREAGKFIPHAASWLNARRWEDEAAPPVKRPFPI